MKRSEGREEEAVGPPIKKSKDENESSTKELSVPFLSCLFGLNGKVAIVTGGTGVLGTSFCVGLAKAGAKVGVLGRTESKALNIVSRIKKEGGEAIPLVADVLDKISVRNFVYTSASISVHNFTLTNIITLGSVNENNFYRRISFLSVRKENEVFFTLPHVMNSYHFSSRSLLASTQFPVLCQV